MIRRIICALYCVISLCSFSGAALGQEVEIYIPSQHTAAPESEETNNILARCLATGLKEYCVGISFGENGATFESNGISEITLETFVIDLSDDNFSAYIEEVDNVLESIGAKGIPKILVFNKIDQNYNPENFTHLEKDSFCYVSAKTGYGIDNLRKIISEKLFED